MIHTVRPSQEVDCEVTYIKSKIFLKRKASVMTLQLKSTDSDVIFQLSKQDVTTSKLLNDIFENIGTGDILEMENSSTELLSYIVHFMKNYRQDPMSTISRPLLHNSLDNEVQTWYRIFISTVTSEGKIFELLKLANYFVIPSLLDLCCAQITVQHLRTSCIEEIRNELQTRFLDIEVEKELFKANEDTFKKSTVVTKNRYKHSTSLASLN